MNIIILAAPLPGFQFNTGSGDNKLQNKPATGLFGSSSATGFPLGTTPAKTTSSALSFGVPATTTAALSLGTTGSVHLLKH